jgi:hypothetical protein
MTLNDYNRIKLKFPYMSLNDQWNIVRQYRDQRLQESDYTQLPDINLPDLQDWKTYRQELRDITDTYPTPSSVVWPTPPGQ